MQRTPDTRRTAALGKLTVTEEEAVLLSMVMSREIVEYRNTPYDGVRVYVQSCSDIRRKVKRVLERYVDDRAHGQVHPRVW